mgnify:CR=1 FL=1
MTRELPVAIIQEAVRTLLIESAFRLPDDYLVAMADAREHEVSQLPGDILTMLLDNEAYAESERIPTCQDTGMAILFLEIGQDVHFCAGDLNMALHAAVEEAYRNGDEQRLAQIRRAEREQVRVQSGSFEIVGGGLVLRERSRERREK